MVQLVEESISEMDRYVLAVQRQRPVRMHDCGMNCLNAAGCILAALNLSMTVITTSPKNPELEIGASRRKAFSFSLISVRFSHRWCSTRLMKSGAVSSRHQPMNWRDSIRASDNRHTWGCFHCVKLRSVEWTYEREHGFSCIFNLILKMTCCWILFIQFDRISLFLHMTTDCS